MKISHKEKIEGVEKKLHFTVMLGLFFPVLLEALFSFSGSSTVQASETILKSGIIIFFLITNYLLFEWQKTILSRRQLDYLDWVFISTIICFVFVVLFLGFVANKNITTLNWVSEFSYPFALIGFMYIPLVSIIIMIINFFSNSFEE